MRFRLIKLVKSIGVLVLCIFVLAVFHTIVSENVILANEEELSSSNIEETVKESGIRVIKRSLMQNGTQDVIHEQHIPPPKKEVITKEDIKKYKQDMVYRREQEETELEDIFISVKTTYRFHRERLSLLLDTWWTFAKDQTHFFTDQDDEEFQNRTGGHMINTNCSRMHNRRALCCKMSQEFDYFIQSNKRWFCHVDDDTYINIPELVKRLQSMNHSHEWYLGKPSLAHPIEIRDPDRPGHKVAFWFATGGAGVCISRALALQIMPYTSGGKLSSVCEKIRLPDDCSLGYIISVYTKKPLTVIKEFHSHLEGLWSINDKNLSEQITLSYGSRPNKKSNIVSVKGLDEKNDPTRILSVHCALYPHLPSCKQQNGDA